MTLKNKKIIAREILIIVLTTLISLLSYIGLSLYNNHSEKVATKVIPEIQQIQKLINFKQQKVNGLQNEFEEIIELKKKPWQKNNVAEDDDQNSKPKFDPNKPYKIVEEKDISKSKRRSIDLSGVDELLKSENRKYSIKIKALNSEIVKLKKRKKVLTSQLLNYYDTEKITKRILLLLLIIFYPVRLIFIGTIWSIKVLKKSNV